MDLLLLVGALAAVVMHALGLAIRGHRLARGLQANTERSRSVFSTFFLGKLVVKERLEGELSIATLASALRELLSRPPSVERIAL